MLQELTTDELLNALLDELDVRAQQQSSSEKSEGYWVCQRKHPRHPFRSGCKVYFLPQCSSTVGMLAGRTRNLSRSGVGLLIRRVFRIGEPIEVEVLVPDRPPMYMAGLVTFCRYAGRGFYEVGVHLHSAGTAPIFSQNPHVAVQTLGWLQAAEEARLV